MYCIVFAKLTEVFSVVVETKTTLWQIVLAYLLFLMRNIPLMKFILLVLQKIHFPQLSQTSLWQDGIGKSYGCWVPDCSGRDC